MHHFNEIAEILLFKNNNLDSNNSNEKLGESQILLDDILYLILNKVFYELDHNISYESSFYKTLDNLKSSFYENICKVK